MQASRSHLLIIYSKSYTEGSDTFYQLFHGRLFYRRSIYRHCTIVSPPVSRGYLQNNQDTAKLGTALYRWDGEVGALYPRTEEARQRAEIRPFDPHSRQKPKRPDGANRLGVYSKGHPFGRPFSQLQLITPTQKQPLSTPPLLTPNYFLLITNPQILKRYLR